MFDPRSIVGLEGGCVEFRGISFSLYLSGLGKDPDDGCRYEVGRFFNACFWYIFPGEAAIVVVLLLSSRTSLDHQEKTALVTPFEPFLGNPVIFSLKGLAKAVCK